MQAQTRSSRIAHDAVSASDIVVPQNDVASG
jgi:hypothetical protein